MDDDLFCVKLSKGMPWLLTLKGLLTVVDFLGNVCMC